MAEKWSTRYVMFARAHGHAPEAQLEADIEKYPGGCMTGFICWMNERWREFCKERGLRNASEAELKWGMEAHALFDAWLIAKVNSGSASLQSLS